MIGHTAAIDAAQMQRRVGGGRLTVGVGIDKDLIVLAEQ
jgi:hypothetical protein